MVALLNVSNGVVGSAPEVTGSMSIREIRQGSELPVEMRCCSEVVEKRACTMYRTDVVVC